MITYRSYRQIISRQVIKPDRHTSSLPLCEALAGVFREAGLDSAGQGSAVRPRGFDAGVWSSLAGPTGGNPEANLKSISHRCYLWEAAFEWELTKETICLLLGCLQGRVPGRGERGEYSFLKSQFTHKPVNFVSTVLVIKFT